MQKIKLSVTVSPERLARAQALTGCDKVSEVVDRGLSALIEDELERIHANGYDSHPQDEDTVGAVDPSMWSELPWDEG